MISQSSAVLDYKSQKQGAGHENIIAQKAGNHA